MARESSTKKMIRFMKDILKQALEKEEGHCRNRTETYMRGSGREARSMDEGLMNEQMGTLTTDSGREGVSMGREKRHWLMEMCFEVHLKETREKEREAWKK